MRIQEIDKIMRRPIRHWNVDGLIDIMAGILLLSWGTAISAQHFWPSRLTAALAAWAPAATALALALFYNKISSVIDALKTHWTYPRVGYVKVPGPSRARMAAAIIMSGVIAILVAWLVVAVLPRYGTRLWMPIILGAIFAIGAMLLWRVMRLARLVVYAGASLTSGALAQWLFSTDLGVGLVLSAVGAAFIIGGGILLRRLLRLPAAADNQT